MKINLNIKGMSCSACSAAVERAVKRVDGVKSISVSLLSNSAVCEFDENVTSIKVICSAVKKAGFRASVQGEKEEISENDNQTPIKTRLIISAVFLVMLMYLSMAEMLSLPLPFFFDGERGAAPRTFTLFLLTLPVIYVNRKFYINGYKALFRLSPNMDSLVAVGSTASLLYGVAQLYRMMYLLYNGILSSVSLTSFDTYFESSAMILTFVTVGKLLEEKSKRKSGDAVERLAQMSAKTAFILRNGERISVDASAVAVGDIVILKAGDRAVFDGTVVEGTSAFDNSAITGESMPVEVKKGDKIISGGINLSGEILYTAERVGGDTTLSKIADMIKNASAQKAPVSRLADKIAGIFVPTVMGIAVVTFIIWKLLGYDVGFALSRAVSVLVISCPCALGLATPVAMTVSTGVLAKKGILCKTPSAIERMSKADTVMFDKTGTLTEGQPSVVKVELQEDNALKAAVALEEKSSHHLAKAVKKYAGEMGIENNLTVESFSEVAGCGIKGVIGGVQYLCGNEKLISECGIKAAKDEADLGCTLVYIAKADKIIGKLYISDRIKPSSQNACTMLDGMKIETVMLTGDNEKAAEKIKAECGVKTLFHSMLPQDKAEVIKKYRSEGHNVVMVGDGINDSPSLALADVGIACYGGTDVAIDSGEVVLMSNDMTAVPSAISFSKKTLRTVKQNLFWAFFYNVLCIPLAAGVLYIPFGVSLSPAIAAACMSCSSLFVVTNALRLLKGTSERQIK